MPRSKPNTGVIRYAYNGGWNHSWTKEQVRILKDMKTAGAGVAEITDRVFEAEGGPARWENVRDKLKELFPGESIKGDLDDPKAGVETV